MAADLTNAERRLITAAAAGQMADYSTGDPQIDDPAQGDSWDSDRILRSEIIRHLCLYLGVKPDWPVDPKGVRVRGAKVLGDLDFEFCTLDFPLDMTDCYFEGDVTLGCVDKVSEPEPDSGDVDEAEIAIGSLVVPGSEAA